jgi:hypothetical protein
MPIRTYDHRVAGAEPQRRVPVIASVSIMKNSIAACTYAKSANGRTVKGRTKASMVKENQ